MRDVIRQTGARFTHPGAEEIYTTHKERMDTYAARWGILADRVWTVEYSEGQIEKEKKEHYAATIGVSALSYEQSENFMDLKNGT